MKTLTELRAALVALTARAEAKMNELKDDMVPDAVRAIETEHDAIVKEMDVLKTEIAKREKEEADATRTAPPVVTSQQPNLDDVAQRAIVAERTRVATIQVDCTRSGMSADFAALHVQQGTDPQAVRNLILEEMVKRGSQQIRPEVVVTHAEDTDRRAGLSAAIAVRLADATRGVGDKPLVIPEVAKKYVGMGLPEIAAECCGYRGSLRTTRQIAEVYERSFHTTSDFPLIMNAAMGSRLLARYGSALPTYRVFAARYTQPDFRDQNVIRAGDFPNLQLVNEAGEIKGGTFTESKEKSNLKSYAVQLHITRQMLINDQLGAIDQMLSSAGDRVSDFENTLAFEKLASNSGDGPTLLTDSKTVFHTDHGNKGTASAINVTSIGGARAGMMKQTSPDGLHLSGFKPKYLVTGPDTLIIAEQLLAAITPALFTNVVPDFIKQLIPVADPNITGLGWYLFADPAVAPTFVYSYLEGYEAPRLTSKDTWDVQGWKVKLEHDFGVSAIDYRGGYRNVGA